MHGRARTARREFHQRGRRIGANDVYGRVRNFLAQLRPDIAQEENQASEFGCQLSVPMKVKSWASRPRPARA